MANKYVNKSRVVLESDSKKFVVSNQVVLETSEAAAVGGGYSVINKIYRIIIGG